MDASLETQEAVSNPDSKAAIQFGFRGARSYKPARQQTDKDRQLASRHRRADSCAESGLLSRKPPMICCVQNRAGSSLFRRDETRRHRVFLQTERAPGFR